MERFASWSIGRKLTVAFTFLTLIIVGVGLFTGLSIQVASNLNRDVREVLRLQDSVAAMRSAVATQQGAVRGFLLSGDRTLVDRYQAGFDRFQELMEEARALTDDEAALAQLATLETALVDWRTGAADRQIDLMRRPLTVNEARVIETTGRSQALLDLVEGEMADLIAQVDAEVAANQAAMQSTFSTMLWAAIIGALAAVIVSVAAAILLIRAISRPIVALTGTMGVLASGDTSVEIAGADRRDEVGRMAGAVQVFKDSMIETARLQAERESEQEVKTRRAAEIETATRAFDSEVASLMAEVGTSLDHLRSTSTQMSSIAEETNRQASTVAVASEQASANVQTVAAAAEELTASIAEIAQQVERSTMIAGEAVEEARRTNDTVQGLSEAAARIGEIVKIINDIAEQTNLLALNATIEAARAGEAGKGFAVVASEVKNLANQTAKATGDISEQIGSIQSTTQTAVTAMGSVGAVIDRMNTISVGISSAVEEQGAATAEISRNIQEASSGTAEVSRNILDVTRAAEETGHAASSVLKESGELSSGSEKLRRTIDAFLKTVKAA
ncbi:methyl-accepting chemotaxis protein [Inquilinus sp. CAU 1745]|uniref:methyl-accepting chemotaxis protein n=1 Tax=Inquilinus sp. CAU 1745 TaxID=3140369 RepID=UPI00325C2CD7